VSGIRSGRQFAAFLKRSLDMATSEDIRRFQLYLAERAGRVRNRNRIMTGLRFLFRVTLRRLDLAAEIYHIREPQKIPLVMSPDETNGVWPSPRMYQLGFDLQAAPSTFWLKRSAARLGCRLR
jgi:integrase/recombinase XerD